MDKVEYQNRLDEITNCVHIRDYKKAYEMAEEIDWRRVKSIRTLNMISDIYEANKDYDGCKKILVIALNRSSIGKSILYRLTEVCLKQGDISEAEKYYGEFKKAAPRDNSRLILEYKLCKAKNAPLDEQIRLLEEYKDREYTERWAYELALLYSKAGDREKCVEACDDMILWFSEGKYVLKAMELKKKYHDLSPSQQIYFDKEQKVFGARMITVPDDYDTAGAAEGSAAASGETENWPPKEAEAVGEAENPAGEEAAEEDTGSSLRDADLAEERYEELPEETDETAEEGDRAAGVRTEEEGAGEEAEAVSGAEEPPAEKPAEKKKPVLDDREIADPEPSPEEKKTHTISLSEVGHNTIPIPIEEIMKIETPEERRIRILSNSDSPMKMNDRQRQIFTYFARIPGMDSQILDAVTNVYLHAGEHTSSKGNIAIMGAVGSGKTKLSEDLVIAMCCDMGIDVARTARIKGERMNELDPAQVVSRMSGGFLMLENVSDMNEETVTKLSQAMDFRTDCMIVIAEDEKTALRNFFRKYPDFAAKFDRTVSIPVFTNDELVTFARTYCTENSCELDDMGVLALYTLISNGQSEDQPMTISQVKKIVDSAIAKARKGRKSGRKSAGQTKVITLYEKDFSA